MVCAFICGINGLCLDLDVDETLASEYQEFVNWCKSASASGREQFSPRYLNNMGRSLNRRFFATANGLIGMGVPNTRAGDYLCILSGSSGCFVMRQEGSHWKIIGDAYSRRLMKVSPASQYRKSVLMKSTEGLRGRNLKSKRVGGTKSMVRYLVAR